MSELVVLLTVSDEVPVKLLMEYLKVAVMLVKEKPLAARNCQKTELTAGLADTEHVIVMSFPVMTLYVLGRFIDGKLPETTKTAVACPVPTELVAEHL